MFAAWPGTEVPEPLEQSHLVDLDEALVRLAGTAQADSG
jgi:hypothetical protein